MYAVINNFGNIIFESDEEIEFVGEGFFIDTFFSPFYNHDQHHLYNKKGDFVGNKSFRFVKKFKDGKCIVTTLDFKNHIIDRKGTIVFSFADDTIDVESKNNDYFTVKTKDNKYYILNSNFEIIIPLQNNELSCVYEDRLIFTKNKKQGLLDLNGNIIGEPIYDKINDYMSRLYRYNNMIIVTQNNKQGCIDKNGNIIIPIEYDNIYYPYENHIYIEKNNEIKLLNYDGSIFLEGDYYNITNYDNGINAIVTKERKYFLMNNKSIISEQYDYISFPKYNSEKTKIIPNWFYYKGDNEKYGILNKDGKIILNSEYDEVLSYNQQYIIVRKSDSDYILYNNGKLIKIEDQFDNYGTFNEGLCSVEKEKLFGFINELGEIFIELQFDNINSNFENNLCLVVTS